MQAAQTNNETLNISREKLVLLVSQMFGGRIAAIVCQAGYCLF